MTCASIHNRLLIVLLPFKGKFVSIKKGVCQNIELQLESFYTPSLFLNKSDLKIQYKPVFLSKNPSAFQSMKACLLVFLSKKNCLHVKQK